MSPINIAIGIVIATANVPQGFSANAPKITIDKPAIVIVMMNNIAKPVQKPTTGPSSSRITSDSDLPPFIIDANSTTASCTAPPITAPISSQR